MRFAINPPNVGAFGDPGVLVRLALESEQAGWDGYFIWDYLGAHDTAPVADPWVTLGGVAAATERIRLGALVTPVPRRRPWKLARELVTLDHLSGGRAVFGIGIGSDEEREYSAYGEPVEARVHGDMLDEAMTVIAELWSGESFSFEGEHYRLDDVLHLPRPVQQPRIPVWVAGQWPGRRPFRRAARWDGVFPLFGMTTGTPDQVAEMAAFVRAERVAQLGAEAAGAPFDIVHADWEPARPPEEQLPLLEAWAAAGVTWHLSSWWPAADLEDVRAVIRRGPPRAGG